jgi:hypothetical protein
MSRSNEPDPVSQALEDGIRLGLIEVVGINRQGGWLYGATQKGKDLFAEGSSIKDALIAIGAELDNLDKFN